MTSCCLPPRMPWSGATGAIARCKRVSTGCGRKRRSMRVWRWICGVKPTPKAVNKPWQHCIVHGLDKPGSSATVSPDGGDFGPEPGPQGGKPGFVCRAECLGGIRRQMPALVRDGERRIRGEGSENAIIDRVEASRAPGGNVDRISGQTRLAEEVLAP